MTRIELFVFFLPLRQFYCAIIIDCVRWWWEVAENQTTLNNKKNEKAKEKSKVTCLFLYEYCYVFQMEGELVGGGGKR